jgi:cytochrome c-type biogenesis protein CcmH
MMDSLASRIKSIRTYFSLLLILSAILLHIQVASAQVPTPGGPTDDEVNAIARQLYCPVCENTPLDVCPTQACAEWRELIREKLAEGWNEAQVRQYFLDRFGDRVLATPPPHGLNWLVYIVPPVVFLVGAYLLYRSTASWRLASKLTSPSDISKNIQESPEANDEYAERLEEELRKL